jgi:hypothetical protein
MLLVLLSENSEKKSLVWCDGGRWPPQEVLVERKERGVARTIRPTADGATRPSAHTHTLSTCTLQRCASFLRKPPQRNACCSEDVEKGSHGIRPAAYDVFPDVSCSDLAPLSATACAIALALALV